jgi:hypothetical protein
VSPTKEAGEGDAPDAEELIMLEKTIPSIP